VESHQRYRWSSDDIRWRFMMINDDVWDDQYSDYDQS